LVAKEKMKIQLVKYTPLAYAPDAICEAINRHTEHTAFVSTEIDTDADVIHFNNVYFPTDKPAIIHYHSEPRLKGISLDCPYRKIVNAQYHALLPEYRGCTPVRQVINFDTPLYDTKHIDDVIIGYSPTSRTKVGEWHDKGYDDTIRVLESLHQERGWQYDIIENVPLDQCITRKQNCSHIIDECVTGSYHRSGLEGLALGKPSLCNMTEPVSMLFCRVSGFHANPFYLYPINFLKDGIIRMVCDRTKNVGRCNRMWMIQYWHPADVIKEYIKIYEEVANA